MSIHYLLDGYNVIHQIPSALNQAKLEDRRYSLVRFIEQHRPQGSVNNPVTIVFDGSDDVFGGMSSSAAKIIFSQGGSADDEIKKIVSRAQNAKEIVVVSDDRDIQYAVRALGAKICAVREFLKKERGPQGNGRKKDPRDGRLADQEKYISKTDESKITSEFSRIWLDPRREREQST
jgi:predicted RNA-binding protein with PIN domain